MISTLFIIALLGLIISGWLHSKVNKKIWLLVTIFVIYVCLIGAYAEGYHYLYQSNPNSFKFNNEIKTTASESLLEQRKKELIQLRSYANILEKLANALNRTTGQLASSSDFGGWETIEFKTEEFFLEYANAPSWTVYESDNYYKTDVVTVWGRDSSRIFSRTVRTDGPQIASVSNGLDSSFVDSIFGLRPLRYGASLSQMAGEAVGSCDSLAKELASLDPFARELWSFADFIYFSAVIQVSGSANDLLPNSTKTRLIVASQVLMGIFLLVVVIASVSTEGPGESFRRSSVPHRV